MKKQVFVLVSSSDLGSPPAHGLEHQKGEQGEKKKCLVSFLVGNYVF